MKANQKIWMMAGVVAIAAWSASAIAADAPAAPGMGQGPGMSQGPGRMMMGGMPAVVDERESAGIPDPMKPQHLARMRSHLEAVHDIIEALAEGEFDKASETARTGLAMAGMGMGQGPGMGAGMGAGMGPGMGAGMGSGMGQGPGMGMGGGKGPGMGQGMCKGMNNPQFRELGMAFHESAGKLADVLKTGDEKESLRALGNTVNYCIQCHAAYRQ